MITRHSTTTDRLADLRIYGDAVNCEVPPDVAIELDGRRVAEFLGSSDEEIEASNYTANSRWFGVKAARIDMSGRPWFALDGDLEFAGWIPGECLAKPDTCTEKVYYDAISYDPDSVRDVAELCEHLVDCQFCCWEEVLRVLKSPNRYHGEWAWMCLSQHIVVE